MAKEKVNTKEYGLKNLLVKNKIDGVYDLFIGEISVHVPGSRYRKKGIIDNCLNEIVPFGELCGFLGARMIDFEYTILDLVAYLGDPCIASDTYGSLLLRKTDEGYKIIYNSDATIMLATNNMLYGANFDVGEPNPVWYDDMVYPTKTFEFDYRKGTLVHSESFDKMAFLDGRLQQYLVEKYFPYPLEKHEFGRVLRRKK